MPGSIVAGKLSSLEVSKDGNAFVPVFGRTDMSLSLSRGDIDASHMDDDGWAEYLPGRRDWTISGTLRYVEEDEGQKILVDNYFSTFAEGEFITVRFTLKPNGRKFEGRAYVNQLEPAPADESPTDMTITLRGTGPLSKVEPGSDS